MFSIYGTVITVTIVTDRETGKSKGFGFITMAGNDDAERAIAALDGTEIDDRQISVRIAEDKSLTRPEPLRSFFKKTGAGKLEVPRKNVLDDNREASRLIISGAAMQSALMPESVPVQAVRYRLPAPKP